MESLIIVVHVLAAIAIVGLVLLQRGKGAEMGASFGSGASQTLFGAPGGGNVLTRGTTIFAIIFFVTSLSLAMIARQQADLSVTGSPLIEDEESLAAEMETAVAEEVPAAETLETEAAADDDIPVVPEQ